MNNSPHQLQAAGPLPVYAALPPGSDFGVPHEQQVHVARLLHQIFRGRYALTGGLAAVGLALGIGLAWLTEKPEYQSVAQIQVSPTRIRLQGLTTDFGGGASFQSYVNTQANFIQSERVISNAMNSPEWMSLSRGIDARAERRFRDSLTVRVPRDTQELIIVTFTDPNPRAAYTGVTKVCESYERLFGDGQGMDASRTRTTMLEQQRQTLENRISNNQEQVRALAEDLGTDNADALEQFYLSKRLEFETQLTEIESQLISLSALDAGRKAAGTDAQPDDAGASRRTEELTVEELAAGDASMAQLLQQMQAAEQRRKELALSVGPEHYTMRRLRDTIAVIQQSMEERREQLVHGRRPGETAAGGAMTGFFGIPTIEQLHRKRDILLQQLSVVKEEASKLAGKQQSLEGKKRAIEDDRARLLELTRMLEEVRAETQMNRDIGRIRVIPPAKAPELPQADKRIKFGAFYGLLGVLLPVTGVGLFGLFDRRYRFSNDAAEDRAHNAPLLGILPRLSTDLSDSEQAAAAAHCVHQIRTLMQMGGAGKSVYAVTSSNPGDGKTSMTLSLGLSFAGAGYRTLMIDLDMVGQGLSRGLKMREQTGLLAAILEGRVVERIRPTLTANLSLLPTGLDDDHRSANRLSEPLVRRTLDAVRGAYDIVLVDTGPVLGSIEAHLVCCQADGVVLVVCAGRARGQVKAAVDQLRRIGARVLGIVFNLAQPQDFRTSAASQSFRSMRPDDDRPAPHRSQGEDYPDMEPLPRVVALDSKR